MTDADSPACSTPPASVEPGASWFIWGIWLAMSAAAVGFVLRFGPEIPLLDDYAIVPVLSGEQPVTGSWLWSLHNEHRVPLPRLVLLGIYPRFGFDFRAGMYATVACLSTLAALLMLGSRRLRGGASYADAFFPIALLGWGHHNNLLWSWQISFGLSTLLVVGSAVLIASLGSRVGTRMLLAQGFLLVLFPLCGAGSLAMVPPMVVWLVGLGVTRIASSRPAGWTAIGVAIPGLLITILYFVGYERPSEIDQASGPAAVLRTALQFLALGLGPIGGTSWWVAGSAVAVLAMTTALLLLIVAIQRPGERARAIGLLSVLAGFGLLALGLAWGRSGLNARAGLEPRYVTLAVSIPCVAVLGWSLYGPGALRRFVPMLLMVEACVLLWPNNQIGLVEARKRRAQSDSVVADLESGMPPFMLIARHTPFLDPSQDLLTATVPLLGRKGLGIFGNMKPDPPFRRLPLTAGPESERLARWDQESRTIEVTGVDPWVTFSLPERTWVAGIRIRYDHSNGIDPSARFKIGWKRSNQASFPEDQQYQRWTLPSGMDRTMITWIAEPIDAFRLQPDNRPSTFRVREMTLLVPEGPFVAPSGRDRLGESALPPP